MRVLVAGITGESQYVRGLRSFRNIALLPGDYRQEFSSGRGDVARRKAGDYLVTHPEYEAILLCDLDMWHPPDLLQKLRACNKDMVTGHYFARESYPLHSIVCEYGDGKWPFTPLNDIPTSGLHRVGMTGMGNALITRKVYSAVEQFLPKGDEPFAIGPVPVITGDHRSLGSDYRFFSLAQYLGYELWFEASVESEHATVFWVNRQLYEALRGSQATELFRRNTAFTQMILREKGMNPTILNNRIKQLEARLEDISNQKKQALNTVSFLERQELALKSVISEDKWLLENIDDQFPTVPEAEKQALLDNRKGIEGVTEVQARTAREHVAQEEARGFVQDLQSR